MTTCALPRGGESRPADSGGAPKEAPGYRQMAVIEKLEEFINYMYPIAQNIPRKHGVARDAFLRAVFAQVDLFITAGKSGQPSRLYAADAGLAGLRFWLRFLADPRRKLISQRQHQVASVHLAEVGGMVNAWIRSGKRRDERGQVMRPSSAATGATRRTPAPAPRTGTTRPRTRTRTSGRAAAVTAISRFRLAKAAGADPFLERWSAFSSCFGEHTERSGPTGSSETSKPAAGIRMARKHRNLIQLIAAPNNLRRAYRQTAKRKRYTYEYLEFKEHAEANLARLSEDMAAGTYRQGPYRHFVVREPKPRRIMALPFRDRVAQHALVNVIEPIFENTFLPQSYACRKGRGTHAGAKRAQALMRRLGRGGPVHCLKVDFAGYFPSIDRGHLHSMLRKKISCRATLHMMEEITPPTGRGLPIGSLTSQLYANVYATAFDRFLVAEGWHHFVRYMDDTVVFGHSQAELRGLKVRMEQFINDDLGLRFSKWGIAPVTRGVNFLGYRIWPTHKLLRRQSVIGAKRKIRRLSARGDEVALGRFLGSWQGHARWADSYNLINSLGLFT